MTSTNVINKYGDAAYAKLKSKYKYSMFWFIFLNMFSIFLISALILLNIFALRWNLNPSYNKTKVWFVVLATLNGLIGVISTVIAFLKIKDKMNKIETALISIDKEKKAYSSNKGAYLQNKNRREHFIKSILDILQKSED